MALGAMPVAAGVVGDPAVAALLAALDMTAAGGRAAALDSRHHLQAQFQRLRSRRGAKKAIGAVAASLLTAAYHMLKNGTLYADLGAHHFDSGAKGKQVLRLVSRIHNLGFAVQITPIGPAA
jgi:hypothetical protein